MALMHRKRCALWVIELCALPVLLFPGKTGLNGYVSIVP